MYVATIALNLITVSKRLSPEEEWREYPKYRRCWKRWWRPYGCTIFTSETLPEGFVDVTEEVVVGYAELMSKRFKSENISEEQFVKNYYCG